MSELKFLITGRVAASCSLKILFKSSVFLRIVNYTTGILRVQIEIYLAVAASRRKMSGSYCLRTVLGRVSMIKSSSS